MLFKIQSSAEFDDHFKELQYYIIPASNISTFVLCLLHVSIFGGLGDENNNFFELCKPLNIQKNKTPEIDQSYKKDHYDHNVLRGSLLQDENFMHDDVRRNGPLVAKMVIMGAAKVGKTAFAEAFHSGTFRDNDYVETVGATFH